MMRQKPGEGPNDRAALLHLLEDVERERRLIEQSKREWIAAFDAVQDPMFIHDRDMRIVRANRAYAVRTGLDIREVIGQPYWQLFPKLDAPMLNCLHTPDEQHASEDEVRLPDGTVLICRNFPIPDADGQHLYSLHLLQDITAQRKAAAEQRMLSEALRQASEAAVVLDHEGRVTYLNPAFYRLFGFAPEEILGKSIEMLSVAGQDQAFQPRMILESLHQNGQWKGEVQRRARDGTAIPILLSAALIRDEQGAVTGYVGTYLDLRDTRRAEGELRLFRTLLDNSSDAIEVVDPVTLRFLDVNEKECLELGYSREELLSMAVPDIDPSLDPAAMKMIDEQVKKTGAALIERTHRRKDGSTFPVEISLKFSEIGGKTYILSIARNIARRKQAEAELRRLNWALQALSHSNAALVHADTEQAMYQACCEGIASTDGYELAWVGLAEDTPEKTVRIAAAGRSMAYLEDIRITWADDPHGRGPTGTVIRTGVLQVNNDFAANPLFSPWLARAQAHGLASSIALPIRSDGKVIGALTIYGRESQTFNAPEIKLFEELADDLGYGIASRRARRERDEAVVAQQRSMTHLREALEATIRAVALTVEKRDPYTAGHQNKVAEICVAIGRELGLPEERLEGLRLGATIHDIGKVYVPAEILNRPGRLTEAEFGIIKSHPQVGYDIIKDVKFPWPVGGMILQHHERLDGSGYPKGLKGEEIILEARILAVADVVEAMTSHRPYRPAIGPEKALAEIEQHRGTRYDPAVTDACLRVFREGRFQLG